MLTPLYFAYKEGHPEIVRFLLEKGANVNIESKKGTKPLWHKVQYPKDISVFLEFIKSGVKVDIKSEETIRLFHEASEARCPQQDNILRAETCVLRQSQPPSAVIHKEAGRAIVSAFKQVWKESRSPG